MHYAIGWHNVEINVSFHKIFSSKLIPDISRLSQFGHDWDMYISQTPHIVLSNLNHEQVLHLAFVQHVPNECLKLHHPRSLARAKHQCNKLSLFGPLRFHHLFLRSPADASTRAKEHIFTNLLAHGFCFSCTQSASLNVLITTPSSVVFISPNPFVPLRYCRRCLLPSKTSPWVGSYDTQSS